MENNEKVIGKLRKCFAPTPKDSKYYNNKYPFTNCALIFAYNGTGKTRLSYDFAHNGRPEGKPSHTLYYNAYTEDIFTWKNNPDDSLHHLMIDQNSAFIQGFKGYNFVESLHRYLSVFTDIDFDFHYDENNEEIPDYVWFFKHNWYEEEIDGQIVLNDHPIENIKISRGEERLFVWCFFRCIMDQVIGGIDTYKDIEYIYIDDPMSSLDDNNVIAFAQQLYTVIRKQRDLEVAANDANQSFRRIKFIISSHHALFFHTMLHGLNGDKRLGKFYLSRNRQKDELILKDMSDDTPFYYNVAMMSEISKAINSKNGKLYTYHFTVLRGIMEKIKEFFGHPDFSIILEGIEYKGEIYDTKNSHFNQDDLTEFYSRVVNVLTHQSSMFNPVEMNDDNKELVTSLFNHLVKKYQFVLPNLDSSWSEAKIKKENNKEQ